MNAIATQRDNATPADLAEQFPCSGDPFAVWFSLDEKAGRGVWAINDEKCIAMYETTTHEAAVKLSRALRLQLQAKDGDVDILQISFDHCCNLAPFFDLIESEIKKYNTSEFDGIEFLVKAAKSEAFKFSSKVCALQEEEDPKNMVLEFQPTILEIPVKKPCNQQRR
jgi:hypothetical protein